MRLKPEKVDHLSVKIVEALAKLNKLAFVAKPADVAGTVRRVVLSDLQREDALETEAEAILKQHKSKINLHNMSYNTLMTRTKQELARKKKIIL